MKSAALLLLLAVAASQVDQVYTMLKENLNITECPITYFGRTFNFIRISNMADFRLCFIDRPSVGTPEDCITLANGTGVEEVRLEPVEVKSEEDLSLFERKYRQFRKPHKCENSIKILDGTNITLFTLKLANFEPQAAFGFRVMNFTPEFHNFTAYARNTTLSEWSWAKADALSEAIYADISGCRTPDALLLTDSAITDPEDCTLTICGLAVLRYDSNNTCLSQKRMCTVLGSDVIDFHDNVYSIPDRCTYTLTKIQGSSAFNVFAGFRERRLQDQPFLDHLIIAVRGGEISLEQGGRVRVDGQLVPLNSSIQVFHGVELSRDKAGVTASTSNMTLLFDGNSAHMLVDMESGPVPPLEGLCGDILNPNRSVFVNASVSSAYSKLGCEVRYPDPVNRTKNCNHISEHAFLLKEEPFTVCHSVIDPELFVTACTDTLCGYPPVDDIFCHFLESYAKACYLKANIRVVGWREKAGCPDAPSSCQNKYCSEHEFCGDEYGQPRCFCRALFAAKYRPTDSLGEPTMCMRSSASISLAQCLLAEKSIDYTTLHLNNKNCTGDLDEETHMVNFRFDSVYFCGTKVEINDTRILYKNTILSDKNNVTGIISRQDQVSIAFSCLYTKPDHRSVSFKIVDSSVVQRIISGIWNYTITMKAFKDRGLHQRIGPNTEMQLNQKVFVQLMAEDLDEDVVNIVTEDCWATNTPSPNGSLRYDLVMRGCRNPADDTVRVEDNGVGTSNVFSFNMFQFAGENTNLFLHCQVELCPTKGPSCKPNCTRARRRRSMRPNQGGAIITMAWS